MSSIDKQGMLVDHRVILRRYAGMEQGPLSRVHAIVVHQTDAPTAQHTFNSYAAGGNGAHFLVDKSGQIYQTASINKRCFHVGRRIKSKCLAVSPSTCNSASMAKVLAMAWVQQIKAIDAHERAKSYPHRYPVNSDSIGIELVGKSVDPKRYESVTPLQNSALQWLIGELYNHFSLTSKDVYRHPEVSYKHPGEAQTATWK